MRCAARRAIGTDLIRVAFGKLRFVLNLLSGTMSVCAHRFQWLLFAVSQVHVQVRMLTPALKRQTCRIFLLVNLVRLFEPVRTSASEKRVKTKSSGVPWGTRGA